METISAVLLRFLAKLSEGIWGTALNCSFLNSVSLESLDLKFLSQCLLHQSHLL